MSPNINEKTLLLHSKKVKIQDAMTTKKIPFTDLQIKELVEKFPTPFHLYDEKGIRDNAKQFNKAFSWNKGFKEYFAVKALPNPYIVKILGSEGFGADCSSAPEMITAQMNGILNENIMFTSNNTSAYEFAKAKELGAIINLDDISHIDYLEKHAFLPELLSFRYNPGALKEGNAIIGNPEDAKYGFTREQMFDGYRIIKEKGVKRFGIHTMVASNELNPEYFIETAQIVFELMVEIHKKIGIQFEFANLGGGIGIPYKPGQKAVDLNYVSNGIKELYENIIEKNGLSPFKIFFESGRMITGPYGFLVTKVQHLKNTYKNYVGVDANMSDLMRPGMYGAYHHITVIGKENQLHDKIYDVTGSLCENNDKFAIDRKLPEIEKDDIIVIHDTGAHGHAMGFNYNAKLRSAEILVRPDNTYMQIRRAENINDYFSTIDLEGLKSFAV